MDNFELISFPSDDALVKAVADRWLAEFAAGTRADPTYGVALSGGRVARKLFAAVASQAQPDVILSKNVHFFWADERCVPPSDPESNFGVARNLLLDPLQIQPDRIHRIRGEISPARAAAEAEAEICRIVPMNGSGQPVLDLIFLGMGEDGHVASLFPGAPPEAADSKAVYLPVAAPKPPPNRISINYPTIASAREVWVLASGAGKEAALKESLLPSRKTPLARVLKMRWQTVIFSDMGLKARP